YHATLLPTPALARSLIRLPRPACPRRRSSTVARPRAGTPARGRAGSMPRPAHQPLSLRSMCQLLGMNANTPTDVMFSFTGLATRADEHQDGFGIAFFEDCGLRLFVDQHSARRSPVAELVKSYPIRSDNVIAHIRKATQGRIALENTHPFMRELWG